MDSNKKKIKIKMNMKIRCSTEFYRCPLSSILSDISIDIRVQATTLKKVRPPSVDVGGFYESFYFNSWFL